MHPILQFASTAYIETQNLLPLLAGYTNPRNFISQLVKKGELIRLKNGFFVIADKIKNERVPYEQIGNLLYGPSYISFEWALSYYGMIPEGVYVVTSACAARAKSFKTALGTFDYFFLSHSRYITGVLQKENNSGKFLIASPEKALADLVHFKSRGLTGKDLLDDLIEARRMEENQLRNLDKKLLMEIGDGYRSSAVSTLIHTLGIL